MDSSFKFLEIYISLITPLKIKFFTLNIEKLASILKIRRIATFDPSYK